MTHYQLSSEEVEEIIQDWPEEWIVPVVDDQLSPDEEERHDVPQTQKNGGKRENQSRENPENTQNESSTTPTDLGVGYKRKQT